MKHKSLYQNPLLKRLSPKKKEIFLIIKNYERQHLVPPSLGFIQKNLSFNVIIPTVYEHVLTMVKQGYLFRSEGKYWISPKGNSQMMADFINPHVYTDNGPSAEVKAPTELHQDSTWNSPEST